MERCTVIITGIAFLLVLLLIPHFPMENQYGENRGNIIMAYTPMDLKSSDSSTIYMEGNLTINNTDRGIMCGYNLIFQGNGSHKICLETNITIMDEKIQSESGNVTIRNENGLTMHIINSTFDFKGEMNLSNSKIYIYTTHILGGHIKTMFYKDQIYVKNSIIEASSPINYNYSRSELYDVARISKNGQPAGGYMPVKFLFRSMDYWNFPVNRYMICLNYSATANEKLSFSLNPLSSLKISGNISLEAGNRNMIEWFNESNAFEIKSFQNNMSFTGYLNASLPDNITIWGASVILYSTSVLNYTGLWHNYVLMWNTTAIIRNTTISGSSQNFCSSGIPDENKTGIFEEKHSRLILIDSHFTSWNGNLKEQNLPVIARNGSYFSIYKKLVVKGFMHSSEVMIKLGKICSGIDNRTDLGIPVKYENYINRENSSIYFMTLTNFGGLNYFNNARFDFDGHIYYVSWPDIDILNSGVLRHNISLNYTSQIEVKANYNYSSTAINLSLKERSMYNFSTNVSTKICVNYMGRNFSKTYYDDFMKLNGTEFENISFPRRPGFNNQSIYLKYTVYYHNGAMNISSNYSLIESVPPLFYTFQFTESNLTGNETWSLNISGKTYHVWGLRFNYQSIQPSIKVHICNSSLFHPEFYCKIYTPGNYSIPFVRDMGKIQLIVSGVNGPYSVTVNNESYEFNISNPIVITYYGHVRLTVNSSLGEKTYTLFLNKSYESLYVHFKEKRISLTYIFLTATLLTGVSLLMVASIRRSFFTFCPYCMAIIRPFSLKRHKCKPEERINLKSGKSSRR